MRRPLSLLIALAAAAAVAPAQTSSLFVRGEAFDAPRAGPLETYPDGPYRFVRGELLLGLTPNADRAVVEAAVAELGGTILGAVPRLGVVRVALADGETTSAAIARYAALPGVATAEPNGVGDGGSGSPPPTDPSYGAQWHLSNVGQSGGTPGADIEAVPAWEIEDGSASILVAVLDTGIAFGNPEFIGRTLPGFDFVNEDADASADHPHGIWAAGLLGANSDNGFGVSGVDRRCTILPVKVLDEFNAGTTFDLIQGIDYSAAEGAHVLSMSLINYPGTGGLIASLDAARDAGSILVACGGNFGIGNADVSWPGASPDTIAIGWTDDEDERSSSSGTGAALDFVAPGSGVITVDSGGGSGFDFFSGCSAATPVAAGVVSLMLALDPELTQEEIYTLLMLGAEDEVGPPSQDTPGFDEFYGHGRINAFNSISLIEVPLTLDPPTLSTADGGTSVFTLSAGEAYALDAYWLLGSVTGTEPGVTIGPVPVTLPLDFDPYTQLLLGNPNAFIPGSFGTLDANGRASAQLTLPAGTDPVLAGLDLHHAYLVFDGPPKPGTTVFASNPVTLHLTGPPQTLFAEDFESGAPGWTFDNTPNGLWHLAPAGECGAVTTMAAYNLGPTSCTYGTAFNNGGTLLSPDFTLSGLPPFTVSLTVLNGLDISQADLARLSVVDTSGEVSPASIGNFELFFGSGVPIGQIGTVTFELPDSETWQGRTARLEFEFAPDVLFNDGVGWLVDDIEVTNASP